jgi:hypothetical protein
MKVSKQVEAFMEDCLDTVLHKYTNEEIRKLNGRKLRETYAYTEVRSPVKRKKGK